MLTSDDLHNARVEWHSCGECWAPAAPCVRMFSTRAQRLVWLCNDCCGTAALRAAMAKPRVGDEAVPR